MSPRSTAFDRALLCGALAVTGRADAQAPPSVEHAGMTVWWRREGSALRFSVHAPTRGWVALGLNDRPGLAGSLLVMGAVRDGVVQVEEHVARPPEHPRRTSLGGRSTLTEVWAEEGPRGTTVHGSLALEVRDGVAPEFHAGQAVWMTLAWSTHDDFGHHSALRVEVTAELPR